MADAPRITVGELKRRMNAGEEFTLIDTRNPQAWAEADTTLPGAIRVPADELLQHLRQAHLPLFAPMETASRVLGQSAVLQDGGLSA